MTDNSSKFNPIKSAGAIILAVLLAAGSVLSVAAAAATPSVKAEAENNSAEVEVYNDPNGSDEAFREFSVYNVSVRHDGVVEKIVFNGGTVADALNQAGVAIKENQISVPAANTEIKSDTDILVLDAKKIAITADGKTQNVLVPFGKIGESLLLAGVRLSQEDILSVERDAMVKDIDKLSIKRVTYKNINVTEEVH